MTIDKISYSESVEAMNASGNKKWFKSSIEIADVNDQEQKATSIAKEYVSNTINKSIEDNPSYLVDPATFHSETKVTDLVKKDKSVVVTATDKEIQQQFETFKQLLIDTPTKELSETLLSQSEWKFNLELKQIVNSK
jgi:predicted NAD/FAD-dependent oxidoreductase